MSCFKFEIDENTSWHELRELFGKQFNGASLMLHSHQFGYDDIEEFSPLVSIIGLHAKTGTILCDDDMTIAGFERACKQSFNLDIEVKAQYNSDASASNAFEAIVRLKAKISLEALSKDMTLGQLRNKQDRLNSCADLESNDPEVRAKAHDALNKRMAKLLDPDFDIDDDVLYRSVFLDFVVKDSKYHQVILLLDPDDVVDMNQLGNRFPDNKQRYDMSQCQTGGYVDFVKQYVLPFAGGSINYLLLDHIDKIPDIHERADFEQLLRFVAKGDEYDPFQNIQNLGRTETINFGNLKNTLIMRCAEVPEFLQRCTCLTVDCRNYVLYVDEMLADEKREDS